MEKFLRWIAACSLVCLSACSPVNSLTPFDQTQAALILQQNYTPKPAKQRISLALPAHSNWQRIDLSRGTVGTPIMLVPPSQTADEWHESIITAIRPYIFHPDITAKKYMEERIKLVKDHCQHVLVQSTANTEQTAVFELSVSNCDDAKDQTQLTKVFNGKDAVYILRYSVTGKTHVPASMSSAIKTATLVPDTRDTTIPPHARKNRLSFLFDHD